MQRLEASGVIGLKYRSLGIKGLTNNSCMYMMLLLALTYLSQTRSSLYLSTVYVFRYSSHVVSNSVFIHILLMITF